MPLDPVLKKFIDKAVAEGRTATDIGKSISEAGWGLSHIQEAESYYSSKKKSSQSTSGTESGESTSRGPVTTSSLGLPQDVVDFSIGQQKKYGLLSETGQPIENVNKGYIWEATEPEEDSYGRVFNAFSEIEAKRKEIEETSASPTYRGPVNERPQYYRPTGFPTSGFGMGMGAAMGAGIPSPYDTRPALSEENRQARIAQLQKEKKEAAQSFIKQSEISYNALLPKAKAYGEEVPDFYNFNGDPSQGIEWVTSKAKEYQKEQLSKLREEAVKEAEKSNWVGRGLNSFVYNFIGAADALGAAINFASQTAVGGKPWEDDYTETELGQFAREGSETVRKGALGEKFLAGYTIDEIQKGVSKNILEGNYEAGLGLLGLESLEMVPQLAAAMAPGGVGLRLLATTSAGDAWARVANDPKYNTAEKIAYAGLLGLAEYYTEKIFSADRDAIRGMFGIVQEKGKKGLGDAMFGRLPKGIRAFVEEGFEESVVDLVTQGLDYAMSGKEFDAYQLADAALLGGTMGGGAFVLSKTPSALGRIPGLQTKIKFDSDIQRIKDILDSKDLSPEERGVLSARLNDLLAESRRTEEQNMMFYQSYSEEDKKRTYELNREVLRLMELHKKTKTDIAKKAITDEIKQKISEIEQIEKNYDSKKGQQVPSQVAQGKELGPVPIEGRSAEEAETSGILQEVEDEEKLAGEKTQALEQEQPDLEPSNFDNVTEETAPTVANALYGYISNTAEAAFKALGTSRRQAARAADSVANVIKSLTKAGKKVNVKVFYSKASMEDWLGSIGEKPEAARGIYVPPGSENKNEVTIGLLAPALLSNTAYHEGLHSIVPAVFGKDGIKRLFKVLMNKLSESDALGEYLRDFAGSASYRESEDQWEEFSVELASLISDGSVRVSVKKGIIDKFMDAMSEVLGIVGIDVKPSAAQLVNILNDYAQNLGAGVELGKIPEIFDTEVLNEMANGDIESVPFINTEIVAPTNVKRQDIVFPKSGTYPVSKITKSDVKDIEAFLKEQVKLGKTFAFWYADQFGRGNYVDPYTGEEYFLDGGPSFPFDPENKKNGDVWASSADAGSLYNALVKNPKGERVPDFVVQISGHPTKMMQFNKKFNEIWINRAKKAFPDINEFKKALTSISKTKEIMFFVENMTSWDEMLSDTLNKNLKEVKKETIGKKGNVKVETKYVPKYVDVRTAISFIKSIEKVPPGEKGELAGTKVYNLLFENGLHPSNFNDARDGYFRKYDFQEGEILCIYKVTDTVKDAGVHNTYSNSIKGEPVLIPNARVFAFDLMPEEIRTRRKPKGTDSEGKIIWGEELQNLSKTAIQKAMAPDFPTEYPITTDEKQIERAAKKLSRKLPKAQRITESSEKLEKLFRRDGIALTKEEAAEILTEVDSWRDWYDGISSLVEEVFGEYAADYMMFMFGSAMAANSASTIGGSINNLDRFYKEEALKGLPLVKQNIYRSMLGLEVNSRKIQQFINAGLGDKNAKPIDMHVWSFMNSFSKTKNPNEVQFKKGLDFVDDVAEVLGWDPREVQATMWAANILRLGGKPDTYEEYIRRKVDKGLNKTIQGWRNKGIKPVFKIVKDGERLKTEYAKEVDREALEGNLEDINQKIAQAIEERRLKAKQAKKETIITSLSERFKGDKLLDLQDTLDELLTSLADVDAEGNVTLYHRTTKENKSQIQKSGQMKGDEDGLFFSTTKDGQAEGYGEAVVKLKVPIEDIQIDDLFEAEAHVRIPTSKAGQIVDVSEYLEKAKPKKPKVKFQLPLLEKGSSTTQRVGTTGSYTKAANIAKSLGAKNILDYGAGFGLGSDAMRNVIPDVESLEPFPQKWRGKTAPTYTDNTDIKKKYDAVVSLNVLNVVRKDMRDAIVKDIFSLLNDNGAAIISTRKFKGDIDTTKNFEIGPEEKSYLVKVNEDGEVIDVFQKGFDGNELVDYLQELLGDEAIVRKDNSYGAAGAIITKSPKAKRMALTDTFKEASAPNFITEEDRREFQSMSLSDTQDEANNELWSFVQRRNLNEEQIEEVLQSELWDEVSDSVKQNEERIEEEAYYEKNPHEKQLEDFSDKMEAYEDFDFKIERAGTGTSYVTVSKLSFENGRRSKEDVAQIRFANHMRAYNPKNPDIANYDIGPDYNNTVDGVIKKIVGDAKPKAKLMAITPSESRETPSQIDARAGELLLDLFKGTKYFDRVKSIKRQLIIDPESRKKYEKALGEKDGRALYGILGNQDSEKAIAFAKEKFPIKGSLAAMADRVYLPTNSEEVLNFGSTVIYSEYQKYLNKELKDIVNESTLDPKDLLREVGYELFNPKNLTEARESFLHFYENGKNICTLNIGSNRFQESFVTFIVKDDAAITPMADKLTQDNLTKDWKDYLEKKGRKNADGTYNLNGIGRDSLDPYSTSVVSLQINKSNGVVKEISRYNHQIGSPDNIFSRDFNKIIDGLEDAMFKKFGVNKNINQSRKKIPYGIIQDADGRFFNYISEKNGVYYGDGFYLEGGVATLLDKNSQRMADGFVINANGKVEDVINSGKPFFYGDVLKVNYIKGNEISLKTVNGDFVFEVTNGAVSNLINFPKAWVEKELDKISSYTYDSEGGIIITYTRFSDDFLERINMLWSDDIVGFNTSMDFSNTKIQSLGKLKYITGNANFSRSNIQSLGELMYIGGNAWFSKSKVQSLGELRYVGSMAIFLESHIQSLGKLRYVGSDIEFAGSTVKSLGELRFVAGYASFFEAQVQSLGKLRYVGSAIDTYDVQSLGELRYVGTTASFPQIQDKSFKELRYVGGYIHLGNLNRIESIGNLSHVGRKTLYSSALNNIQEEINNLVDSRKSIGYGLIGKEEYARVRAEYHQISKKTEELVRGLSQDFKPNSSSTIEKAILEIDEIGDTKPEVKRQALGKNLKRDVSKVSRMSAGSFSGRMYNYLLILTTEDDQGKRKIAISKTEWMNTMTPIIGANEASDMYDNVLNNKIPQDAIDTSLTSNIDKAYEDSLSKIERETRKAVFTIENLIVKLIDRQHLIKAAILKANISRVKNLIVNKAGSSSRALHFVRSWENRIYKGLSEDETTLLDKLIVLRRVKAIDDNFAQRYNDALDEYNDAMQQLSNQQPGTPKYDKLLAKAERAQRKMEEAKPPTHPEGINGITASLEMARMRESIGDDAFNNINERASEYFDAFSSILDEMYRENMISEKLYEQLAGLDYQPRVFLEHMFADMDQNMMTEHRLTGPIIKRLKEGSDKEMLFNSRYLFRIYAKNAFSRIARNKIHKELAKYADTQNWISSSPRTGFSEITFYGEKDRKKGVQQNFYLKNDLYNSLNDVFKYAYLSPKAQNIIGMISGARLLKFFATQVNPLFVVKNIPRDFLHILFFTDFYDKSPLPVAAFRLGMDYISGINSKITEDKWFNLYIKYGGGMEFLSTEGEESAGLGYVPNAKKTMMGKLGMKASEVLSKTKEGLGYLGELSEIAPRIGIFKALVERNLRDANVDIRSAAAEPIIEEAVAMVREIIDFAQGGELTKAGESAIPYLNAAFQGFRVASRYAFVSNPKQFAYKLAQLSVAVFALALYNSSVGDDDMEDISDDIKFRNWIILTPFRDKDGNRFYLKIAKTQQLQSFAYLAEIASEAFVASQKDREPRINDDLGDVALKAVGGYLPKDVGKLDKEIATANPFLAAIYTYKSNYDAFRDAVVSRDYALEGKNKVFPQYEDFYDKNVPYFYKAIGQGLGVGPKRLQASTEKMITSPHSSLLVMGGYALADSFSRMFELKGPDGLTLKDQSDISKSVAERFDVDAKKIFLGVTNPETKSYEKREQIDESNMDSNTRRMFIKREADKWGQKLYEMRNQPNANTSANIDTYNKTIDSINAELSSIYDKQGEQTAEYFRNRVFVVAKKGSDIPQEYNDLLFASDDLARAKILYMYDKSMSEQEIYDYMGSYSEAVGRNVSREQNIRIAEEYNKLKK